MNKRIANVIGGIITGVVNEAMNNCNDSKKEECISNGNDMFDGGNVFIDGNKIAASTDTVDVEEYDGKLIVTVTTTEKCDDSILDEGEIEDYNNVEVETPVKNYICKMGGFSVEVKKTNDDYQKNVVFDFDIKDWSYVNRDDEENVEESESQNDKGLFGGIDVDTANDFQTKAFSLIEESIKEKYGENPNTDTSRIITQNDFVDIYTYQKMCQCNDWFVNAKNVYVIDRTVDLLGTMGYLCFCKENGHYCYIPEAYIHD